MAPGQVSPDVNTGCDPGPDGIGSHMLTLTPKPGGREQETYSFHCSRASGLSSESSPLTAPPGPRWPVWVPGVRLRIALQPWSWVVQGPCLGLSCWVAVGGEGRAVGQGEMREVVRLFFFFSFLVLSMLHNPLGSVLGKSPLGFLPLDPLGADVVDKFPAPSVRSSRLDTRPILDSRSSSPSDSDTSGFSSGSDHLSDLIVCSSSGGEPWVRVGGRGHRGHRRSFSSQQDRGCVVCPRAVRTVFRVPSGAVLADRCPRANVGALKVLSFLPDAGPPFVFEQCRLCAFMCEIAASLSDDLKTPRQHTSWRAPGAALFCRLRQGPPPAKGRWLAFLGDSLCRGGLGRARGVCTPACRSQGQGLRLGLTGPPVLSSGPRQLSRRPL